MKNLKHIARDEAGTLLLMAALSFGLTFLGYLLTLKAASPIPKDGTGMLVGRDFVNFWMYGRAAFSLDPGRFYDWPTYVGELISMFGEDTGQSWSYPPSIMLIAAPFGLMPYMVAYLLWTALATGAFVAVVRREFADRRYVWLAVLSPAATFCFLSGQNALLTSAVIIAIFSLLDTRPVLAGILIGCLSLKPQLAIMFPFLLLVTRRWQVFMSAALTTLALAALTALVFGPGVWVKYVTLGLPIQNSVLTDVQMQGAPFMPTIFMNARQAGLDYAHALALQSLFSVAAVATLCWIFWKHREADKTLLFALFTACTICGSPYLLSYDLMPLTCAILMLMARGLMDVAGRKLAFFAYWLTTIQLTLGSVHIPGPALLVPIFAGWLACRIAATPVAQPALLAKA